MLCSAASVRRGGAERSGGRGPEVHGARARDQVGGTPILVITRKVGERICIADDIVVEVLDIVGSTVRIGIEAPTEIRIFRQELWLEIQAENKAASETTVEDLPPKS
ncbi:MAG TPA: carbon storage regulator CsrA [Gaiellaceae bacterium]